jgi:nickel-dependent lactate racemase
MLDRPLFLVDCIRGSSAGRFAGFWAGDLFKAHQRACDAYLGWKSYPLRRPYDLVLSASGGFPTDGNLIQAHKGLDGAARLAAPGGVIVHCAECADGLGAGGLERWLAMETMATMERELRRDYVIYGQTLYAIREKSASRRIHLVSRLRPEWIRALGMRPAESLDQALAEALPGLPRDAATAVFPDGGSLLPVPAGRARA